MCLQVRKAQEEKEIMEGMYGASGGEVGAEVLKRVVRTGGFNEKMTFERSPEAVEGWRPSDFHKGHMLRRALYLGLCSAVPVLKTFMKFE